MINRIFQYIILIKEIYIWILSSFIPKDKTIWVFGSMRGEKYMDNAKYLYEYIHHNTDIKAIWISRNNILVNQLKEKGFTAYSQFSKEGKYYTSKAKVAVVTHRGSLSNISDLPFFRFSKKTKIIQLWHGIPLKKIAYDDTKFSFRLNEKTIMFQVKKMMKNNISPFLDYVYQPSLTLALSKETKKIFSKAFRIPEESIVITGYPRNDIFLDAITENKTYNTYKKLIYMPTFRGSANSYFDVFLKYNFNINTLDEFLTKENMKLDIKLHPFNKPSDDVISQLKSSKHISFLEDDDIYEVLAEYDMLITDYSSIYFDYLLSDRPIIFAPFDKNDYLKNDREFYYNYDSVTPGPKAMNWDDIMDEIQKFKKDPLLFEKERKYIKDKFHQYQDSQSSKRVYEAIWNLIHE